MRAWDLQAACESEGWRFCFIDGLALERWGLPAWRAGHIAPMVAIRHE